MRLGLFLTSSLVVGLSIGLVSALWDTDLLASRDLAADEATLQPEDDVSDPRMPELPPALGPQPLAMVDHLVYDFGSMERRANGEHDFVFTNMGDYPLRLSLGNTTCKCTISNLETESLQPGESTNIKLEWRVKGEEALFRQEAVIFTNDRKHRRIALSVQGTIFESLVLNPTELVFSNLTPDEESSAKARIFTRASDTLEVVSHTLSDEATASFFQVTSAPIPPESLQSVNKSGCEVTVTVKPGLPLGTVRQTIRLQTNLADVPPIELFVSAKVGSPLVVIGPPKEWNQDQGALRLGTIESAKGATRELKLMIRGPQRKELRLEKPVADPPVLQATLGELQDLGNVIAVPLKIVIPPGTPAMHRLGNQQGPMGEITIETNRPEVGQLKVKVSFAVAG